MECAAKLGQVLESYHPQIVELGRLGKLYPNGEDPEACEAFTRQVQILNGLTAAAYGFVVECLKKCDDPQQVSDCWSRFISFADELLGLLSELKERFPHCGTPEFHDSALDYRLAAAKRKRNAEEEIECLKKGIPDLFQ